MEPPAFETPVFPLRTVTVSDGLTFRCPYCNAEGHRAALRSDVFAVPPGHESARSPRRFLVRCFKPGGSDWWLSFTDLLDEAEKRETQ